MDAQPWMHSRGCTASTKVILFAFSLECDSDVKSSSGSHILHNSLLSCIHNEQSRNVSGALCGVVSGDYLWSPPLTPCDLR